MTGGARKPKPGWLDSAVLSSPSLTPPGIHHYLLWSRLLFDSSRSSRSVTSCLFLCSLQEMHHFLPCRLDKLVCSQRVLLKSQLPQEMCFSFSRCQLLRSDFCANFPPFFSCCFLSCFQKALSTSIFCLLLQYNNLFNKWDKHLCWRHKINPLLLAVCFPHVGQAQGINKDFMQHTRLDWSSEINTSTRKNRVHVIKNCHLFCIYIYLLFSVFPKPRRNSTNLMLNGVLMGDKLGKDYKDMEGSWELFFL